MSGFRQFADVLNSWGDCEPEPKTRRKLKVRGEGSHKFAGAEQFSLAKTIESEVIPRLMLAHRASGSTEYQALQQDGAHHASADEVEEFSRLVLNHDCPIALEYLRVLVARGVSADAIYLELLAPAARLLGELWKADLCDFTDVTIGLSRLQQLLHEISPQFEPEVGPPVVDRRVLLVPLPGEQHTLGIMLVEEFFRREGWETCSGMPKSQAELARRVAAEHFDVVGVSVSCVVLLDKLAAAIEAVRAASLNKGVLVMVGGPVFLDHPEYAQRVGADSTATDGRDAVLQVRSLSERVASRVK